MRILPQAFVLPVAPLRALLSLTTDGVDLVHEDDGRGGFASHHEQFSNHTGPYGTYVCMYVYEDDDTVCVNYKFCTYVHRDIV